MLYKLSQNNILRMSMFNRCFVLLRILYFRPFSLFSISLSEGGTPAKFLIIDDGWQDTTNEFQIEGEPFAEGSQ